MCFTIARPSPVPRVVRVRSPRKKRSNRPGQLGVRDAPFHCRRPRRARARLRAVPTTVQRETVSGVADRVGDEVLDQDAKHPRTERKRDVRPDQGDELHPPRVPHSGEGSRRFALVDDRRHFVPPSATTARPDSSSDRKRMSSTSSDMCSTTPRRGPWSSNASVSAPGSAALSSRASSPRQRRCVRSCETASREADAELVEGVVSDDASMANVLIVEDDEVIARADGFAHLAAAGHEPKWVAKGEQGLAALRFEPPDVCGARPDASARRRRWLERDRERAERGDRDARSSSSAARGTEHDRVMRSTYRGGPTTWSSRSR